MKKPLLRFLGIFLLTASAHAADVALAPNHPTTYTVRTGDTLWDISKKFLQQPWLWPEIWQANPQVENPHLIFPGDVLSLVYEGGKPRLRVQRGDASRTVKLGPQVRVEPIDAAIPAIPLEKISPFLNNAMVVSPEQMQAAPYVVAGGDEHLVTGAGDTLYGRGALTPDETIYGVYRPGDTFVDPVTGEVLGLEARDIGTLRLLEAHEGVSSFRINRSTEEIRVGDRLIPYEEAELRPTFYPVPPAQPVKGVLLSVQRGLAGVGAYDVVAINRGKREGLQEGTVLAVHRAGEVVKDPVTKETLRLPDVRAGLMMVFRAFDKVSYAIILESDRPLSVGDTFSEP